MPGQIRESTPLRHVPCPASTMDLFPFIEAQPELDYGSYVVCVTLRVRIGDIGAG
jgi:hypothetical protein